MWAITNKQRKHLIILIVVLLIALIVGAIFVERAIEHSVYEAYALKRTNYLLIDYVCQHQKWPSDWEVLIPLAESQRPGFVESDVAELRDVVGINWNLDLQALLDTALNDDRTGFQTTHLLSSSTARWNDPTDEIYYGVFRQCLRETPSFQD